MNALCALRVHRPVIPGIWNRGIQFSRCGRCGHDLVATNGSWERVPPRYRVVWKSGLEHSLAGFPETAPPLLAIGTGLALTAILLEKLSSLASAIARRRAKTAQRISPGRTGLAGRPIRLLVHLPLERAEKR